MNEPENVNQQTGLSVQNYFDLARLGKNNAWRYLLSAFFIIFCWLGFSIFMGIVIALFIQPIQNPSTVNGANSSQLIGGSPWITLAFTLISFIPLLLSLLFVVKIIHRRPLLSLITPFQSIDWKRMTIGFVSFLVLSALGCIFEAILYPGRYQFTFNFPEFIKYVPLIVIFIPIQAATEELVFRGYLTQSLTLLTRHPWIAIIISSALFMLLHFSNPEVAVDAVLMFINYFLVGLFFALITLKDNRLELAIGCHIGNNMFVLLANYSDSALPVPSIFTSTALDPLYSLISFVILAAIFYVFLDIYKNRDSGSLTVKGIR